jgi:hypothetical protein
MSELSFPFPIPCIGILGLLMHKMECLWFTVTSRDFILEAFWKSIIKMMLEWALPQLQWEAKELKQTIYSEMH